MDLPNRFPFHSIDLKGFTLCGADTRKRACDDVAKANIPNKIIPPILLDFSILKGIPKYGYCIYLHKFMNMGFHSTP